LFTNARLSAISTSKFATALRDAARNSHASFRHDGFEASVIEIEQNDFQAFFDRLQAYYST